MLANSGPPSAEALADSDWAVSRLADARRVARKGRWYTSCGDLRAAGGRRLYDLLQRPGRGVPPLFPSEDGCGPGPAMRLLARPVGHEGEAKEP